MGEGDRAAGAAATSAAGHPQQGHAAVGELWLAFLGSEFSGTTLTHLNYTSIREFVSVEPTACVQYFNGIYIVLES